ncbi:hypothetical protein TWF694_006061 [Orbilia ellipsospora]|uniref:F-box domain-containing protein n=1 Tax=Orbilia ellipsospora TaxID=2528407 RepID=A0AAV9WRD4_9PEZI
MTTCHLLALPQELLLDIFQRLDYADLARSKRVSKQFNKIAECIPLTSYTFKIDHVNHSAWKFISYIIRNPDVGKQLKQFRVEWHRRIATDKRTWTEQWKWSPGDLELLEIIKENTLEAEIFGSALWEVIEDGINSEALLPLLLYYTENLESLDLGDVQLHLIICELDMQRHLIEAMVHLFGGEYSNYDDPDPYGTYPIVYQVPGDIPSALWVQIYSLSEDKEDYLPGLKNLKRLRHGLDDETRCTIYTWGWQAYFLPYLLLLPQLEELEVNGFSTQAMTNSILQEDLEVFEDRKSNIKRLVMHDGRMLDGDFELIASITEKLERVSIEINLDKMPAHLLFYDSNRIVESFLKHNEKLTLDDIKVDGESGSEIQAQSGTVTL